MFDRKKIIFYLPLAVFLTLGISISLQSILAAWTAPTAIPPANNVSEPVNEGGDTQVKSGAFGVAGDFLVGTDDLYVDETSGEVGIGTSNPYALLDLSGNDKTKLRFSRTTDGNAFSFYNDTTGGKLNIQYRTGNDAVIYSNIMSLDYTGKVGIGTTTPVYPLTILTGDKANGFVHTDGTATIGSYLENSRGGFMGTFTNHPLKFFTYGQAEAMTIFQNGDVSVGTTNHGAQLQLGDTFTSGGKNLLIGDDTFLSDIDTINILGIYGNGDPSVGGIKLGSNGQTIFGKNNSIGIGVDDPLLMLDVKGKGMFRDEVVLARGNPATNSTWHIDRADGTDRFRIFRQPNYNTSGTEFFTVLANGNIGIGTNNSSPAYPLTILTGDQANGFVHTDGTVTIGSYLDNSRGGLLGTFTNHPLKFFTNGQLEAMTINTSGNIGIGTINPQYKLDVAGVVRATSGFLPASDASLKKDISTISNGFDKINSLRGVSFSWKKNEEKSLGVIAQEVEKIFPELVSTDNEGLKSVNYDGLIGPLIEAVKEQARKIDKQEELIESLAARLNALEAKE